MPVILNNTKYYRTTEACKAASTSRNTYLRWVRQGLFTDVAHRDRKGWRLFTEEDLDRLVAEVNRVHEAQLSGKTEDSLAGP